jgi:MoxR-like ATPase
MASRAHAFLGGREFVSPHDVKSVAMDILRHRVIVSYEAEAEERTPEDLIQAILENMEIPV